MRARGFRVDVRQRVRVAANQLGRFEPCDGCSVELASSRRAGGRGCDARAISRRAEIEAERLICLWPSVGDAGPAKAGPYVRIKSKSLAYFTNAAGAAKTLAAARCVAFTQGAGHAPMPTTPTMQTRIARPRSGGTWMRVVRTGSSMYILLATRR